MRVGLDVGPCGRLFRLALGVAILLFTAYRLLWAWLLLGPAVAPDILAIMGYSAAVALAYLALYRLLLSRAGGGRAWLNTLLVIGPPYALFFIHFTLYRMDLVLLALLLYIGVSLVVSWRIRYGGCEMVALPILVFKRRCVTYCAPVVAVDVLERKSGRE